MEKRTDLRGWEWQYRAETAERESRNLWQEIIILQKELGETEARAELLETELNGTREDADTFWHQLKGCRCGDRRK